MAWQLGYFAVAAVAWLALTPARERLADPTVGSVALVGARNLGIVVVWYGTWHYVLYRRRRQGTRWKFNARWPGTSSRFTWGSQLRDNVFWSLVSGIPIMTAYEVVSMWLLANGHVPWLTWATNPVWFVVWMLLIPLWRELHFYWIHRAIHHPWLYAKVHSLHHRNTNPGPWSGLAMHPLEHVAYFSAVLIHWVVPSHPLHLMFNQFHLAMDPVPGHLGFDRVATVRGASVAAGGYSHYLHHKLFEVNYGGLVIPLDRWFGSFHDGSAAADAALRARRVRRRTSAASTDARSRDTTST